MTQICRDFQSRVYYKWILSQPCVCVCYFALLERGSELQKQIGGGKILGDSDGRNENHFESSLKKTFLLSKVIGFSSFEKDSYAIASSSNLWKKGNYTHRKMEKLRDYHLSIMCFPFPAVLGMEASVCEAQVLLALIPSLLSLCYLWWKLITQNKKILRNRRDREDEEGSYCCLPSDDQVCGAVLCQQGLLKWWVCVPFHVWTYMFWVFLEKSGSAGWFFSVRTIKIVIKISET